MLAIKLIMWAVFLRPLRLKEARQAVADAKLSQAELTQIENEEILKIIELQKKIISRQLLMANYVVLGGIMILWKT